MASPPSQRWVVIDDKDAAITYQGLGWLEDSGSKNNIGNFGAPYLNTLHGSSRDGSVFFSFNGTAINVDGTNVVANAKTNPDPNFECFIDNVSVGREAPFEFDENNWGLCKASNLSPGPHTLRIDVKVMDPKNSFWLDKIFYVPITGANLEGKVILLDNADPAVRLDAGWQALGDTARMTTKKGSIAQVDFIGESITWMSFIPNELPHAGATGSWYLDSDSSNPTQFLLTGIQGSSTLYNQVFFTTPKVTQGRHTLTVTFLGSESTTPLTLDYLYIQNGTSPAPSTGSNSGTNSNQDSQGNNDTQSGNGDNSSGTPLSAILGGVLGGLGFLIIIFGGIFFYRRRQAKKRARISLEHDNHEYKYTPFNVNAMENANTIDGDNNVSSTWATGIIANGESLQGNGSNFNATTTPMPPMQQSSSSPAFRKHREAVQASNSRANVSQPMYQVPYVLTHNPPGGPGSVVSTNDTATTSVTGQSVVSGSSGWPASSQTVQHSDSGMRLADPAAVIIEEVPPHYTPN